MLAAGHDFVVHHDPRRQQSQQAELRESAEGEARIRGQRHELLRSRRMVGVSFVGVVDGGIVESDGSRTPGPNDRQRYGDSCLPALSFEHFFNPLQNESPSRAAFTSRAGLQLTVHSVRNVNSRSHRSHCAIFMAWGQTLESMHERHHGRRTRILIPKLICANPRMVGTRHHGDNIRRIASSVSRLPIQISAHSDRCGVRPQEHRRPGRQMERQVKRAAPLVRPSVPRRQRQDTRPPTPTAAPSAENKPAYRDD
jgi:hypothetical protein